jgi:hypothetical protein
MRLYHYLETKWALENIRRRRLKLSKIDDMNDPWEWKSLCSNDKKTQEALDKTATETVEMYGVACFSQYWDNILMWSHYADRHKGICLGFDIPDEVIRKVMYEPDVEVVGALTDLSTTGEVMTEGTRILDKLFETKYIGWEYEGEFRVNGSREEKEEETGFYFVPFGDALTLREVIAGAKYRMSKKPIEDALNGYAQPVTISKATTSATQFKIVIDGNGFRP